MATDSKSLTFKKGLTNQPSLFSKFGRTIWIYNTYYVLAPYIIGNPAQQAAFVILLVDINNLLYGESGEMASWHYISCLLSDQELGSLSTCFTFYEAFDMDLACTSIVIWTVLAQENTSRGRRSIFEII